MNSESDEVQSVIDSVARDGRRKDALALLDLLTEVTGEPPKVWSSNTIGFGQYHYRYASGQEGDFFTVGFSPRKDRLTLYVMSGLRGFDDILERLGKYRATKSAIHLKRLGDVDEAVLRELIVECVNHVQAVEREMGAIPRMSEIPPRQA